MLHTALFAAIFMRALRTTQPTVTPATPQQISLDGRWRLTQPDRKLSVPASVPGVAQADLLAAGKIPNPFYRDNDKQSLWVGQAPWIYSRAIGRFD